MKDKVKVWLRLSGAVILASAGMSLGLALINSGDLKLWLIPIGISLGSSIAAGFSLIWTYRIRRLDDKDR